MPNHFHLVLRPLVDGELGRFMGWVVGTHTMRYHAHFHTAGTGHVYQQRFKSFPIQDDDHFFVARVNEPLTAGERASVRLSAQRGRPFGGADWVSRTAERLHLESTLRPRGRQRLHFPQAAATATKTIDSTQANRPKSS